MKPPSWGLKFFTGTLAGFFFVTNSLLAYSPESNFWAERKKSISTNNNPVAAEKSALNPETMMASLPQVQSGLALPFSHKALTDLGIQSNLSSEKKSALANKLVPDWIQNAIAPYATIQAVHFTKNPRSKTVFLIQDAHLHYEAQTNIAKVVEGLGAGLKERSSHLMIGLEGADSPKADFSAYAAYPHRVIIKEVADALLKANILNGAEAGVIGYQDGRNEGPLTLPFEVSGIEKKSEYEANVKALVEAEGLKGNAEKALASLKKELINLKKTCLTPELLALSERTSAYEEGRLG